MTMHFQMPSGAALLAVGRGLGLALNEQPLAAT
jgi:hypothetical protein